MSKVHVAGNVTLPEKRTTRGSVVLGPIMVEALAIAWTLKEAPVLWEFFFACTSSVHRNYEPKQDVSDLHVMHASCSNSPNLDLFGKQHGVPNASEL